MKRLTLLVSGNVQRAGYSTKVVSIAEALTIKGYIQNLPDGRVKIIAEGNEKDLERFIQAVNIKNTFINVVNIEKKYSSPSGEYEGFYKLVGGGETDESLETMANLLNELIHVTKHGFDRLEKKQDEILNKFDELGDGRGQKIDQNRVGIPPEIHSPRDDFKSHFDERLTKMEFEFGEIKAKVAAIQFLSPSQMNKKSQGQKAKNILTYFYSVMKNWPPSNYPIFLALVLLATTAVTLAMGNEPRAESLAIYAYYFLVIGVTIRFFEFALPKNIVERLGAAKMRISAWLKQYVLENKELHPQNIVSLLRAKQFRIRHLVISLSLFFINAKKLILIGIRHLATSLSAFFINAKKLILIGIRHLAISLSAFFINAKKLILIGIRHLAISLSAFFINAKKLILIGIRHLAISLFAFFINAKKLILMGILLLFGWASLVGAFKSYGLTGLILLITGVIILIAGIIQPYAEKIKAKLPLSRKEGLVLTILFFIVVIAAVITSALVPFTYNERIEKYAGVKAFEATYYPENDTAEVTFEYSGDYLNKGSLLSQIAEKTLNITEYMFMKDPITEIQDSAGNKHEFSLQTLKITAKAKMIDNQGNNVIEPGLKVTIDNNEARNLDYENISNQYSSPEQALMNKYHSIWINPFFLK
jgi:acylphosphatase